jgi:ubiquinone/menaquinone biosynthesis C-methylase UbiE
MVNENTGDTKSFDTNWKQRPEALYTHWTRGKPANQIQLAFRRHWLVFNQLMQERKLPGKRVLEVGCGRGSLSCYFSDNGYETTLLDYSAPVLEVAKAIFSSHGLVAKFVQGDALALPFADNSFDMTFSIGLLEHFDPFEKVIEEQTRILAPGGLFIGYVVPENPGCVQKDFNWINKILALYSKGSAELPPKDDVFRTTTMSAPYIECMKKIGLVDVKTSGTYPVPMISPSPSFPFTLMPAAMEQVLTEHFEELLTERERITGRDGWLCEEKNGQAFLVWGWKR